MGSASVMIENGLNLRDLVTTGSVLHISQDIDYVDDKKESSDLPLMDLFGQPVMNLAPLAETMTAVDHHGYVKKKILVEGGGLPLHEGCTVTFAFSFYFEGQMTPFDLVPDNKPMVQDLNDNGLLPGLQIAIKSMLVGETSVFILGHQVMYGEMGIAPRIKKKADCVVYLKLIKSILTSSKGKIDFSAPNMFQRVIHEVKLLYASGSTLYKTNNIMAAIQLFQKGVRMLHKCRLADENEEKLQEKMLKKSYISLVICYNKVNKPLLACTACNELNRLNSLWNNGKVLFQNAKSLRMIGEYDAANVRLLRAKKLSGNTEEIKTEYDLLINAKRARDQTKTAAEYIKYLAAVDLVSQEFKDKVNELIRDYKHSKEHRELLLPENLNSDEMAYVKEACIRENLFCTKLLPDEDNKTLEERVRMKDD